MAREREAPRNDQVDRSVGVQAGNVALEGDLAIPPGAEGIVVFAHGSGSGRFSLRNRFVARTLRERGLGTLLIDLLTTGEESEDRYTAKYRFDINLLTDRLTGATDWVAEDDATRRLRIGFFGASTGAAAALRAAALRPASVHAVVSRGGRSDLAGEALDRVRAPTLFIVGGADVEVLRLNRQALERLHVEKELAVVPDATHLFEEPGALEQVGKLAGQWFLQHLVHHGRQQASA